MTNTIGYYGQGGQSAPEQLPYYQNIYDAAEWGPCDYDATHNFVGYAVYDLPVGTGRAFGKNMNKVARRRDRRLAGQRHSSLHTGFPLTVIAAGCFGHRSRGARADCIAPPDVFGRAKFAIGRLPVVQSGFLRQPAPGTFGSCGVGTVRGPGSAYLRSQSDEKLQDHGTSERRSSAREFHQPDQHADPEFAATRAFGTTLGLLQSSQGARNDPVRA